ncbi:MAG: RagB/SusD family nutrient uptake outer membrane protein [Bacteroidetes bacterium]|nr:RagB/SusD family nutrient uptake outer membrane protein [Bacteroidota bacterium]
MRNKFLQAAGVSVLLLCSCKKSFLDQTDPFSVTSIQFFTTESDILLALNGCYQAVRSNSALGETSDLYTDQRSDDTGTNDNQSNGGEPFQFGNYSILPTNSYLEKHWVAMYQIQARCNALLSNIDKVAFSDSLKPVVTAEARFLRALTYFHLVRKWGDVPMSTVALTTPSEISAATYRVKARAVYGQIISDLTDAYRAGLPARQPDANRGRASQQAVTYLLGQVYLTRYATLDGGNAGTATSVTDLDSAGFYLTACYNLKTFGSLSAIPYTDVFDVNKKATCPELIWQIVYVQGDPNSNHSNIAASAQAAGEFINTRKKITSGVGYNVTHDLVNEYEPGDLRGSFSIRYDNEATVRDWYITKYRDTSSAAGPNGYGGNDWPIMRYADVILMLAEVNMYKGDGAAAINYLNMVRARAGMPDYATSMNNAAYAAICPTLKLAILHERRVELAFEHHRWFDLLRFFSINDLVAYMRAKPRANFNLENIANFSTKDEYFPIPYNETILDPVKMYQNSGY